MQDLKVSDRLNPLKAGQYSDMARLFTCVEGLMSLNPLKAGQYSDADKIRIWRELTDKVLIP